MKLRSKIIKTVRKTFKIEELIQHGEETEWAHIYHDSIKDKPWLNNLSLNIGRMAGNYSFFYVLNRILSDYKPKDILEFGLGESSKVVSMYLDNYLKESNHDIVEQDEEWMNHFTNIFKLSSKSTTHIFPLIKKKINEIEYNGYEGVEDFINKKYDFYLIDGPTGSPQYSRYDIVNIAKNMNQDDEFTILLDDYNRVGEQETFEALLKVFEKNNINVHTRIYNGAKSVAVIGTEKYKFVKSL